MPADPARRRSRYRLSEDVRPSRVELALELDPERSRVYRGRIAFELDLARRQATLRLHARDLQVRSAHWLRDGRRLAARIEPDPANEQIELRFDETLPAGSARLELVFRGRLRDDLCGLYAAESGGHRYAFSQLEAADARRFFPCFDEPALKARYRIAVTTDRRHAVISNSPPERVRRLPDGRQRVEFAETPPLSSYLIALAVGRLEASAPVHAGPTAIRIWHVPGKRRLTRFGLEAARECLERLERWFGLPYPYAKLDLVAVPDFEFGAMENAGAVFFRETLLLLDPHRATLREKKRAAEVIAHELAHMWYGNLVTMQWWDDLWLNESFATWMAFAIVDDWKPEWKLWLDFQHGSAEALELDALRHTHPIYARVATAAQASENFDLITYEKGAAVVRMLERYLGPRRFRDGVRRYIRRHREGNARASDLWQALSEVSREPVDAIARAWIEQAGHPLLSVHWRRRGRGGEIVLRQRPFAARRSAAPRWPIPCVLRSAHGKGAKEERHLLRGSALRIPRRETEPPWIYANGDECAFLRPQHRGALYRRLLGDLGHLHPIERMALARHQWALARAGQTGLGDFLSLADRLLDDEESEVLVALQAPLRFLAEGLLWDARPDLRPRFDAWLERRLGPRFAEPVWRGMRGEPESERALRAARLELLSIAAPEALRRSARAHCARVLDGGATLAPDLADACVALAARDGDAALFQRFAAAARSAQTPQEARRFLLALGSFQRPAGFERALALSLGRRVPTQDVVSLLIRLLLNPAARLPTWRFARTNWKALSGRLPPLLAGRFVEQTWWLLRPAQRREVADFFARHPLPGAQRALRQSLERFDDYRVFRRSAAAELEAWLRSAGAAADTSTSV